MELNYNFNFILKLILFISLVSTGGIINEGYQSFENFNNNYFTSQYDLPPTYNECNIR